MRLNIIVNNRPAMIFLELKDSFMSIIRISRKLKISYSYTKEIIDEMVERGFAEDRYIGVERRVTLTQKGSLISDYIWRIQKELG